MEKVVLALVLMGPPLVDFMFTVWVGDRIGFLGDDDTENEVMLLIVGFFILAFATFLFAAIGDGLFGEKHKCYDSFGVWCVNAVSYYGLKICVVIYKNTKLALTRYTVGRHKDEDAYVRKVMVDAGMTGDYFGPEQKDREQLSVMESEYRKYRGGLRFTWFRSIVFLSVVYLNCFSLANAAFRLEKGGHL